MSPLTPSPLLDALSKVVRELRVHYDQNAQAVGLSLARVQVLMVLKRHDGITQADLAKEVGIEAPTLKRHIDALEAAGYLERRPSESDSRKRALFVTQRACDPQTLGFIQQLRSELLVGITDQEQELVCAVLERIRQNAADLTKP